MNQQAILLGFYEDDKLSGFCAATTISKGFNKNIIKNNFSQFFVEGFRLLFTKPFSLVRLIKNFSKSNPNIEDKGEYAELVSIAVSLNNQSQGIGKKLLKQLEIELKQKGCSDISLTTDFNNNEKTIQFYKGLDYNIYYEFIAYPNRKMIRMIKKIN